MKIMTDMIVMEIKLKCFQIFSKASKPNEYDVENINF